MTLNVTTPSPLDAKRVIAVGRYSYEKGYDILLSVWAMVEKQCEDWQLDIYGMGDPTPYVKRMTELSIDKDRCHLNASLVNVVKEYLHSSILVQPSRFESFGLALVEAMACGLPVVAFDCENGPRAIISDGENGYLVPAFQMETFAARLVKLMKSEELRKEMGERGRLSSEQYHIDKVALQWKELFDELMAERCSTT
jgi:glycosyltransferase involved in cell wall biosynthesis